MNAAAIAGFFSHVDAGEILLASGDTVAMLIASLVFGIAIGLPVGILLSATGPSGLAPNRFLYGLIGLVVNVLRSVPFVILFILLIPVTLALVGTSLGVRGAVPPLVLAAAPFFARLVETALREVDRSAIDAAKALGASKRQIVLCTLLPEALPSLVAAVTVTAIALVSYTAMVGAGGLGDLAVRYGYQRFQTDVMAVTVVIIMALVQGIQTLGDMLVARFHRRTTSR